MPAHDPSLNNEDLAPVPRERRTWGICNFASLWVAMSVCIPTYMLASGLIAEGVLVQREMERERFPLGSIPPFGAGIFKASGSTDPM